MLFTSLEFCFFFLPVVILVNFILPRRAQNIWLFIASLFFYAWGEPFFVVIMMGSILVNYTLALMINHYREHVIISKIILSFDVFVNLAILFVYKYMNYVTSIIHYYNSNIVVTEFVLPIGISFYTFQALSYVIDIYKGEKAQTNLINVGLYIAFFPQLIAGPIVRYRDIKEQIAGRTVTLEEFSQGIYRFLTGFNKKMMLANMVAIVADKAFDTGLNRSVFMAWVGALCYTLQIYFDFSGYSDMAIGLGKLMGFELPMNFNYPYSSKSISEFWRRWHISLGQWFRDYLYFPLGGSKVSNRKRLVFNIFFVWLMTGIWHGANMTFVLWGVMYGLLITVEKLFEIPARVSGRRVTEIPYQLFTILTVMIGWVLFRSDSIYNAMLYLSDMFGVRGGPVIEKADVFWVREYGIFIIMGILCSLPCLNSYIERIKSKSIFTYRIVDTCLYFGNIGLFIVGLSYLIISAHNPFIYFNF